MTLEVRDLPAGSELLEDALRVLQELRPHLDRPKLDTVLREGGAQGLRFIGAYRGATCVGVAAFRLIINTSAGRKLYVDDLVVTEHARATGVGTFLLDQLIAHARTLGASLIDLDSGVQRFDAHRFYLQNGFHIRSHHFARPL